jgi:NADH:ubiquinone oxidoreductase subunit 5 (subunit L)/multisubunit Na+/H+ antiporter MnhA subunit
VGIGLIGITLAVMMYRTKAIDPAAIADKIKPLYKLSKNKWYIDEIYDVVFVQGSRKLAKQVLEIDMRIVDGIVNLAGFRHPDHRGRAEVSGKWTGSVLRFDRVWGRFRVSAAFWHHLGPGP